MCKESTELTVMQMAELLHPPVKQLNGASPHPSLLLQLFLFRAAKGQGPSLERSDEINKRRTAIDHYKSVFIFYYCNCCLSYELLSDVKQATYCTVGVSVNAVVWPHLLPMVINLDPEGPTLPLPKCTIVIT